MSTPFLETSQAARDVFEVSVALFLIGEFQQAIRVRRRGARSAVVRELVFRAIFFAGILMLPICLRLVTGADVGGAPVFVAGAVVGWFGLLLRWWSFATLGRLFTLVVKASADQPVVDRGPYRWLRHPSYTGLALALLGCGLMLGNWASAVACTVLVTTAVVYRLLGEELALVEAVGAAYLDYAQGRARLVPFLW